MGLMEITISDLILNTIKRNEIKDDPSVQFKITTDIAPPTSIYNALKIVNEKYCSDPNRELTIRIAQPAIEYWNSLENYENLIDQIRRDNASWIDELGNLTFYRNSIAINTEDNVQQILILVGSDKVKDQGSLEHIPSISIYEIWEIQMAQSFKDWIEYIAKIHGFEYVIQNDKALISDCDALLKIVLPYSDQVAIAHYLESIPWEEEIEFGATVFEIIAKHLNKLGLGSFLALNRKWTKWRKNVQTTLAQIKSFFSGHIVLENTKYKRSLKSIEDIRIKIANKELDDRRLDFIHNQEKVYPSFQTAEQFLDACEDMLLGTIDIERKDKLMQCDSYSIINYVLKYKAATKKSRIQDTEVFGNSLEMILSALWDSLVVFSRGTDCNEFSDIETICIEPVRLIHNIPASEIDGEVVMVKAYEYVYEEKLGALIGGIDQLLSKRVFNELTCFSDDMEFVSLLGDKEKYSEGVLASRPSSTPALVFKITINDDLVNRYIWKIFDTDSFYINANLVKRVSSFFDNTSNSQFLPVFMVDGYQEVFNLRSEEDMRDLLLSSIGKSNQFVGNLLADIPPGLTSDPLFLQLASLGMSAKHFYKSFAKKGLYAALEQNCSSTFIHNYVHILNSIADGENVYKEFLHPLLMRAFWIIDHTYSNTGSWQFQEYLGSGIVSLLHPAMVEMLSSQILFLTSFFTELVTKSVGVLAMRGKLTPKDWSRSTELATLQSPIPCVFESKRHLSTMVRGKDSIFRLGVSDNPSNNITSLTQFRKISDEDSDTITDSDLTRRGEESALLERLLFDYFNVYSLAEDGISIAVFKNSGIQPIISALISLVKEKLLVREELKKWYEDHPFILKVTFYSDTSDDSGIIGWINQWQSFWDSKSLSHSEFQHCKLEISHRMLKIDGDFNSVNTFESKIGDELDADISILYEMSNGDDTNTTLMKAPKLLDSDISIKFPLLEKMEQRKIGALGNSKRVRILSNRQFGVYRAYLRYLLAMERKEFGEFRNSEILVSQEKEFSSWKKTLDWCHRHSERVICIGGEIDTDLITVGARGNTPIIVGFGSGVGAHAELNYTVSCAVDRNETIIQALSNSFKEIYENMSDKDANKIVKSLFQQSTRMADLSLVRTLGTTNYYKHDYFGYTLTRKMLQVSEREGYDCDVMLSLDSYRHWFYADTDKRRADLLWVRAKHIEDEGRRKYLIKLNIIEIKMAYDVENKHLDKAINQVQTTIPALQKRFRKATESLSADSRYWWMQLYRIIASNPATNTNHPAHTLECLENLAEGVFEIEWEANIFCYDGNALPDSQDGMIRSCKFDGTSLSAYPIDSCEAYILGPTFVKELGLMCDGDIPEWENYKKELERRFLKKDHTFDLFEAKRQEKEEEEPTNTMVALDDDFDDESFDNIVLDEMYDKHGEVIESEGLESQTEIESKRSIEELKKETRVDEVSSESQTLFRDSQDLKVLIGTTKRGEDVFWDFGPAKNLVNRHMFILGGSGSGKTYAIQGILAELAKNKQASLIMDYTNGFTVNQVEDEVKPYMRKQWYVANRKLEFNPFIAYSLLVDPDDPESLITNTPIEIAQRIVDVFIRVYGSIGENQTSILAETIENGVQIHGEQYSFTQLYEDLLARSNEPSIKNSVNGLLNKIGLLLKLDPFSAMDSSKGWRDIYDTDELAQISVFQLTGIAQYVQKTIIEFSLWDLWNHVISVKATQDTPRVVVLDEIQNLSLATDSPVRKYLQEGRKLGLALIAATQSFAGMKGLSSPEVTSLMNAGTKLFFRPTEKEIPTVAKMISNFDPSRTEGDWRRELSRLGKGECIAVINTGSGEIQRAKIVKVPSMEMRNV